MTGSFISCDLIPTDPFDCGVLHGFLDSRERKGRVLRGPDVPYRAKAELGLDPGRPQLGHGRKAPRATYWPFLGVESAKSYERVFVR